MIGGDSKFVLTCTHTRVLSQSHTQHIIHFEKDSPNGGQDRIILHFPIRNRKEKIFWCRQVGLVYLILNGYCRRRKIVAMIRLQPPLGSSESCIVLLVCDVNIL